MAILTSRGELEQRADNSGIAVLLGLAWASVTGLLAVMWVGLIISRPPYPLWPGTIRLQWFALSFWSFMALVGCAIAGCFALRGCRAREQLQALETEQGREGRSDAVVE